MKSVFNYIQEKLVFKKDSYIPPRELPASGVDTTEISKTIGTQTPGKEHANYTKMEYYKNKGSDPKRLAKSIKDKTKLINRWFIAININWIDCAIVFRDEIINRGYATEDELDVFVLNRYNKYIDHFVNGAEKYYEEYLDEINIKYEHKTKK